MEKPSLREELELERVGSSLWKWDPCANNVPPTLKPHHLHPSPSPAGREAHSGLSKSNQALQRNAKAEGETHPVQVTKQSLPKSSKICKFIFLIRSARTTDFLGLCLHVTCDCPSYAKYSQTAQSKQRHKTQQRIAWFQPKVTQLRTNNKVCPSKGKYLRARTHQEQSSDLILTYLPQDCQDSRASLAMHRVETGLQHQAVQNVFREPR